MAAVLYFFFRLAPLIFLLLALGVLFGVQRIVKARQEMRTSVYGLEREVAHRHMNQAVSALLLAVLLIFAEFVLVVFLVPNIPAISQLATPTLNPLLTPSGTLPLEFMETLGVVTPVNTSAPQSTGCIPGQINITNPKPGDQIQGSITLQGSATIPNFGFYKYEFAPLGSDSWAAILASRKPVPEGDLGNWDTSAIATGDYQLRLVVTDNQGNELPACVVPVRIKAP
jgi:hypothetical protein